MPMSGRFLCLRIPANAQRVIVEGYGDRPRRGARLGRGLPSRLALPLARAPEQADVRDGRHVTAPLLRVSATPNEINACSAPSPSRARDAPMRRRSLGGCRLGWISCACRSQSSPETPVIPERTRANRMGRSTRAISAAASSLGNQCHASRREPHQQKHHPAGGSVAPCLVGTSPCGSRSLMSASVRPSGSTTSRIEFTLGETIGELHRSPRPLQQHTPSPRRRANPRRRRDRSDAMRRT